MSRLFPATGRAALPALVSAMLALAACGGGPAAGLPSPELQAHRGELAPRLLLSGELEAVEAIELGVPRTPSWTVLIQWLVDDGAVVAQGDRLVELDNSSFADNLEEQRIALDGAHRLLEQKRAQARADLISAQLAVETTRIALAKAEIDAAIPAAVLSRRDYQANQLALVKAEAGHQKAVESLRVAEQSGETEVKVQLEALNKLARDVTIAESAIATLVITAPTDGTVVVADHPWEGRKLQEGDSPWVGLTVVSMPTLDRMQVAATLLDVDDGRLAPGVRVECTLDAYPELQVAGRVREVTPIAQEPEAFSLRRAFRVKIDLETVDPERMRPGMSVKVVAAQGVHREVVLAPRAALDLNAEQARVRLAGGAWREVLVGVCSAQQCVVEEGLAAGERLAPAWGGAT